MSYSNATHTKAFAQYEKRYKTNTDHEQRNRRLSRERREARAEARRKRMKREAADVLRSLNHGVPLADWQKRLAVQELDRLGINFSKLEDGGATIERRSCNFADLRSKKVADLARAAAS